MAYVTMECSWLGGAGFQGEHQPLTAAAVRVHSCYVGSLLPAALQFVCLWVCVWTPAAHGSVNRAGGSITCISTFCGSKRFHLDAAATHNAGVVKSLMLGDNGVRFACIQQWVVGAALPALVHLPGFVFC